MTRFRVTLCVAAAAVALIGWSAGRPEDILFERQMIDPGASETVAVADINGDGKLDIVSGENWYEAPKWIRHKFRQMDFTNNYVDNFSDLPLDVNGDGRIDIVSFSYFGKRVYWSENPGKAGGAWKDHTIASGFPTEFAFLVDLDNDGKAREVLPEFDNPKAPLTWYEVRGGAFVPHVVADHSFGHGIGVGDVNKDGRNDILVPTGWFEAPADPRSGVWTFHADFNLGSVGFIHVLDVNGDGRPDIVTSMAHDYGIFWMEQTAQGTWTKHTIDDSWSQSHSLVLADINGDGQLDLVTGKRFMAHNGRDPGEKEPLGIYWYEYFKTPAGGVEWVKHIIDYSSRAGAGMQVTVAKVEGKPYPEVVVGGKSGLFLFRRAGAGSHGPELLARDVVNAADYRGGGVSPGENVVLFPSNAGPPEIAEWRFGSDGKAPTTTGATRVFFDKIAAPVVYSVSGQVGAVVPYEVSDKKATEVVLEYQSVRSPPVTLPVLDSAPALFTLDASGKGQAAMLNETGCCNSVRNPAPRGTVVSLYGTGEGQATPQGTDGTVSVPGLPAQLRVPRLPVKVTVGGVPAEVRWVRNIGSLQLNVRVPANAPVGDAVPLVLTVGGSRSPDGVTMAIRSSSRRVLVVDHEPAVRNRLSGILKGAGYEVLTARESLEAEAQAKGHNVDLVISDLAMPQEECLEMIRALRDEHPKLKIIAMSGAFGPEVLRAADILGAQAVLRKPLTALVVRRRVHDLLREPSARY